jgi:hypothetical protein
MSLARALLVGTGVGVAGWLLENLLIKRYDSPAFRGVPFLPIYASGGLAVALLAPRLEGLSTLERFTAYGVALSALEEAAGRSA